MKHLKHFKHMLTTYSFSVTSPCYLRMEARRCVEFTGVELTSGAELAAPMEKATTSLVEKVAVGPRAGESHDEREAQWRGRKTGCRTWAR
jgi:hypothetical protein